MKLLVTIVVLAVASGGAARAHHEPGGQHPAQTQAAALIAKTATGTGVVQHIDQEKSTVTIKHGPLHGINVPAMTASYVVKGHSALSNLRPQQNVEFEITYESRRYFITSIR